MDISIFLKNRLLQPPSIFIRRLEGSLVCATALAILGVYSLIKLDLCERHDCSKLEITKIYIDLAELYIILGLALAVTGIYLFRDMYLIRMYRMGILLTALTGAFFSLLIVIGILIELNNVT